MDRIEAVSVVPEELRDALETRLDYMVYGDGDQLAAAALGVIDGLGYAIVQRSATTRTEAETRADEREKIATQLMTAAEVHWTEIDAAARAGEGERSTWNLGACCALVDAADALRRMNKGGAHDGNP